jgi:hypothetical protein
VELKDDYCKKLAGKEIEEVNYRFRSTKRKASHLKFPLDPTAIPNTVDLILT